MGALFLLGSYAVFFHIGQLLMRLVVVQPVGDMTAVRWCFASTLSLSLSLFSAVLADMAHASLLSSSTPLSSTNSTTEALAASWYQGESALRRVLLRLQLLVEVDAREFTLLLVALLVTVVVACPCVALLSCFQHTFRRRKQARRGKAGHDDTHRRGSTGGSGGRRSSASTSSSRRSSAHHNGFYFEAPRSRLRRACQCGLRLLLVAGVVALVVAAGCWASRRGLVSVQGVRQRADGARRRAASLGQRAYAQLQARTTLFQIPDEIASRNPAEPAVGNEEAHHQQQQPEVAVPADGEQQQQQQQQQQQEFVGEDVLAADAAAPVGQLEWTLRQMRVSAPFAGVLRLVRVITSRIAVVGVAMIGLLSGYAAITSPCLFLAPYLYWRGRQEELRRAQLNFNRKLCFVLASYGNAQRQIASLQHGVLHEEWASPSFPGGGGGGTPSTTNTAFSPHKVDSGVYDISSPLDPSQQQFASGSDSAPRHLPPPPPPETPGSSFRGRTPTTTTTTTARAGPVKWLQTKLSAAAKGGAGGRYGDSPSTPQSTAISPAVSRQRSIARIRKLREESRGSRFLCLSLYLQLSEVDAMLRDAQRGETWVGRWYAALGIAMAFYSAVKIALTGASLWFFKASTQDPVTRAVSLLEDAFILRRRNPSSGTSFSVTAVEVSANVILALALLVNGYMVVSSIRGVLLALFHVTMSFSGSAVSRPETVAVGLSMLIGVYFMGQLVLLRASLPASGQRAGESALMSAQPSAAAGVNVLLQVLGTLPYYYYQRLNDWCFMVGCVGAVIARRFVMRDAISSVVHTASGGEER